MYYTYLLLHVLINSFYHQDPLRVRTKASYYAVAYSLPYIANYLLRIPSFRPWLLSGYTNYLASSVPVLIGGRVKEIRVWKKHLTLLALALLPDVLSPFLSIFGM